MTKAHKNYRDLRAELDAIMAELENAGQDVEKATEAYQRGMKIIAELEAYLASAENTVKKIKRKLA